MRHDSNFSWNRKKQCQHAKKICLYYEELGDVQGCLKNHGQHITHATFFTSPQFEELGNEDI